jgi:hypothetical protein
MQFADEAELEHTVNWHFSVEGLQAVNDRVLQLTSRLELPNLSRRSPIVCIPRATARNSRCVPIP